MRYSPKPPTGGLGSSAEEPAKVIGSSVRTVERARVVLAEPEDGL